MVFRAQSILAGMAAMIPARRFGGDNRGVSAVEFALILPFMLTLYLGGVQLSQAIDIDRKATLVARTLADLTSQVTSIDSAGVTTILNAGTAVMSPYADSPGNAGNLMVRVSSIYIDKQLKASVKWSKANNGSALSGDVTVPGELGKLPDTYLILGEATYAYTPPIGYVLTGTMNLDDKIYMRPRLAAAGIPCSNC